MATFQLTKHRALSAASGLVMLMLGFVLSAPAEASCGDYLYSRHSRHEKTVQFETGLSEVSVTSSVYEAEEHGGPIVPSSQPCSGPECGKAPLSIPLPVPSGSPSNAADQYPAIFRRPHFESPASARQAGPCSTARAVPGFPLPIDVPPELLS